MTSAQHLSGTGAIIVAGHRFAPVTYRLTVQDGGAGGDLRGALLHLRQAHQARSFLLELEDGRLVPAERLKLFGTGTLDITIPGGWPPAN